ncbi:hypothetical protein D3C72_2106900 [compost metagenome]
MGPTKDSSTTLTTNSPEASRLTRVSFFSASGPRRMGQKAIVSGFDATTVKKLKGARLSTPSGLRVETKAIGRGSTVPMISL